MVVDKNMQKALEDSSGKGYKFKLAGDTWLNKQDYILNYLSKYKNKDLKLLDIGCCGHTKNIDTQIRNDEWLHGRLDL